MWHEGLWHVTECGTRGCGNLSSKRTSFKSSKCWTRAQWVQYCWMTQWKLTLTQQSEFINGADYRLCCSTSVWRTCEKLFTYHHISIFISGKPVFILCFAHYRDRMVSINCKLQDNQQTDVTSIWWTILAMVRAGNWTMTNIETSQGITAANWTMTKTGPWPRR